MTLDLRQLQIFRAVHRLGSVGQAARHLNLSQPAVSKTIKRIEEELEVPLFERQARGMVPTPYADSLAVHAELVSSEMDVAVETIRAMRGLSKGTVKVGATPSIISGALPKAIDQLLALHPGLSVKLVEGIEDQLLPPLLKGEVDVIVCGQMRRTLTLPVVTQTLFTDQVCVICSPDHPLRSTRAPALSDMLDYPWVLPGAENVMWRRLSDVFTMAGLKPPVATIETGSATFMKRMTERGDYLTFLSRTLTHDEERAGRLAVLAPSLTSWNRDVVVVRRAKGTVSRPAAALIATLGEVLHEIGINDASG